MKLSQWELLRSILILVIALAVLSIAFGFIANNMGLFKSKATLPPMQKTALSTPAQTPELATEPVTVPTFEAVVASPEPIASTPLPVKTVSLPRLNESDAPIISRLATLPGGPELLALLVDREIIRKSVRAIHGLSEGTIVQNYRPVSSPLGRFKVIEVSRPAAALELDEQEEAKRYQMDSENFARYERYTELLLAFKPETAAQIYRLYTPLLQQAYDELGLEQKEVQRVVLAAIDNLLSVEWPGETATLKQPSVMYVFEDKSNEQKPATLKYLMRIGPKHRSVLQNWLREFRKIVQASR